MTDDPLHQRLIYATVAAAKPGITVAAVRLALLGYGEIRTARERSLVADRLKELRRRGCIKQAGGRLCPVSGRTATVWVSAGPYVEPQPSTMPRRQAAAFEREAARRKVKAERRCDVAHIDIAPELEAPVGRLRRRFAPVVPVAIGQWRVGTLPHMDTATLLALDRGDTSVVELLGF